MVDLLSITPAQMQVFQAGAEQAFLRRLVRDMRGRAPPALAGLDDAGLARVVRAGVARARAYGLTWESTLAGFVYVMGDVSPNWDGQPVLHEALLRQRATADQMFAGLFDRTPDAPWDEAAAMRSGAGWFLPVPLPWARSRERLTGALQAVLEPARPVPPATALALADAGVGLAYKAGLEGEDAAFVLAAGLALAGEARLRAALAVLDGPGRLGQATRVGALRAWVRHNTGLWV